MLKINLIKKEKTEVPYDFINFPDGETIIDIKEINRKETYEIITRICSANDLMILMQVGDILNRNGVEFNINITYLMSMRMDRVMEFGRPFDLRIVANCINSLNAKKVSILEPHSDRTLSEINNSTSYSLINFNTDFIYVFPDKGARDRYNEKIEHDGINNANANIVTDFFSKSWVDNPIKTVFCNKERDVHTGNIKGIKIENPELLTMDGRPLIIIDDLCDGGRTFVELAKEIEKYTDKTKQIFVTHMVNENGIKNLESHYDLVEFTNSYKDWDLSEYQDKCICKNLY